MVSVYQHRCLLRNSWVLTVIKALSLHSCNINTFRSDWYDPCCSQIIPVNLGSWSLQQRNLSTFFVFPFVFLKKKKKINKVLCELQKSKNAQSKQTRPFDIQGASLGKTERMHGFRPVWIKKKESNRMNWADSDSRLTRTRIANLK